MNPPRPIRLSVTSIQAFMACPTRYQLRYVERLRPVDDKTDALRVGSVWHKMHEIYQAALSTSSKPTALYAAFNDVDDWYRRSPIPVSKTLSDWEVERTMLKTCFAAYMHVYANDTIESVCSELPFELPVYNPQAHINLSRDRAVRIGRFDEIIYRPLTNSLHLLERKTTSRGIEPSSNYWEGTRHNLQVRLYALAFRDMCGMSPTGTFANHLLPIVSHPGFARGWVNPILYDVLHKPSRKLKKLSQKDTAAVLETGIYEGELFTIEKENESTVLINGVPGVLDETKSGKPAMVETLDMYAAGLRNELLSRPEFYFQRREIVVTPAELQQTERDVYRIYNAIKSSGIQDSWFHDTSQCASPFRCPFIPICYGDGGSDAVCKQHVTPPNFYRQA